MMREGFLSMKRWFFIFVQVLLLLSLTMVSGCGWPEKKQVRETVRLYNEKKILALKRPEPELMDTLTTKREKQRVLMYILYQYQKKVVIDARLLKLETVKTEVNGNKATVQTKEEWVYKKLDVDTRKPVKKEEKIYYDGTYSLEKTKEGRWVVADLKINQRSGGR